MLRLSLAAATALDAAARLHIDQPVDRLLADRPHYALLGQAENARRYAQIFFEVSQQPGVKSRFPGLRLRSLPGAGRSGGRRGKYRFTAT